MNKEECEVLGLAHIGCTVKDLDSTLRFMSECLCMRNQRTQFIDKPYLSGVTGFKGCAIQIGFAQNGTEGRVIELLEYQNPKGIFFENDFSIPGSAYIGWSVRNIEKTTEDCSRMGAVCVKNQEVIDAGIFANKKHTVVKTEDGILHELIEGEEFDLVKIGYIVTSLDYSCKFFERIGFHIKNKNCEEKTVELQMDEEGIVLELREAEGRNVQPIQSNMVGNVHCCLMVRGLEEIFQKLLDMGALKAGTPTEVTAGINAGAYAAYISVLDQIKLELFQGKPTQV